MFQISFFDVFFVVEESTDGPVDGKSLLWEADITTEQAHEMYAQSQAEAQEEFAKHMDSESFLKALEEEALKAAADEESAVEQ